MIGINHKDGLLKSNEDELKEQIPETVREFRFGNFLLKVTRSKTGSVGLIMKNTEQSDEHHTMYFKDDQPFLHYTQEGSKGKSNKHTEIDVKKFLEKLAKTLEVFYLGFEKLELTDSRFLGKTSCLVTGSRMIISDINAKKANFEQDVDYHECLFENTDVAQNGFGSIVDGENEIGMLMVKDGELFFHDLKDLESKMAGYLL